MEYTKKEYLSGYDKYVYEKKNRTILLDNQTSLDLNRDELFQKVDFTVSAIGKQYLFYRMGAYNNPHPELKEDLDRLEQDPEAIPVLEKLLAPLDNYESFFLVDLFWNSEAYTQGYQKFGMILSVLGLIGLPLSLFFPSFLPAYILLLLLNTVIYMLGKRSNLLYYWELKGLKQFVRVCLVAFGKDKNLVLSKMETVKCSLYKRIRFWLRFIDSGEDFESSIANEVNSIARSMLEYVKMLFLAEFLAQFFVFSLIRKNNNQFRNAFESLAYQDFLMSILKFRSSLPCFCEPEFDLQNTILHAEDLFHPLIENFVPQRIHLNKHTLVFGPNMSGKTTFLRTVGINVILAQSLLTACAKVYKASFFSVISSIQIVDNLMEGESLYLAEVKRLKEILDLTAVPGNFLILIDEIFKGTNNEERLAAATAYLEYLSEQGKSISLTTTHQTDLIKMLNRKFMLLNMKQNSFELNGDFVQIQNGIKLLEDNDYPKEITDRARMIAGSL